MRKKQSLIQSISEYDIIASPLQYMVELKHSQLYIVSV